MEYKVIIGWDDAAQKFFVVESDVEGLWLEKPSFDALVEAIREVAHELIEHNHGLQEATPKLRIFRQMARRFRLAHKWLPSSTESLSPFCLNRVAL